MRITNRSNRNLLAIGVALAASLAFSGRAAAHCDTLDGPVVAEARIALDRGDVTPVLKWVKKEDEKQIRAAFQETLAVRREGPEAKAMADRYFLETLVRIHRAGEGAPYTGLKSAGSELGPAVAGSDKALDNGSVDALVKLVTEKTAAGIQERFHRVVEKKKRANESVEAGREFVAAYIEFTHYTERLYDDAARYSGHDHSAVHGESTAPAHGH